MCRSRRDLSNEYLLAKISVDTAENEPLEVWWKIQFNIHSPPYLGCRVMNRKDIVRLTAQGSPARIRNDDDDEEGDDQEGHREGRHDEEVDDHQGEEASLVDGE